MTLQVFSPDTDGKIQMEVRPANGFYPTDFPPFSEIDRATVHGAMSGLMIEAIRHAMSMSFFDKGPWYTTPFAPIKWILPFGDFEGEDRVVVRILLPSRGHLSNSVLQRLVESFEPAITIHFPMWKKDNLGLVGVQVGFLDVYVQESRAMHYARNDATQGRVLVAGASRDSLSAAVLAVRDMDAQEGLPFYTNTAPTGIDTGIK